MPIFGRTKTDNTLYIIRYMNRFRIYVVILICAFAQVMHAQQIAVKTDVLLDALTAPNLGLEMVCGEKSTVGLSFMGCNKPYGQDVKIFALQPEYRYWINGRPMTREFIGLCALGTSYTINRKNTTYDGLAAGLGLTFGYNYNISKRFNIEGYFGFGAVAYSHREYRSDALYSDYMDDGETKVSHNTTGYVLMPTKIGISVSYIIK